MKYRLEMANGKDAPDQCKYRLAWVKSNVFTRANRKLKQRRRRRQRERQKNPAGLDWQITTLHVHHAFLYISLPSLHDYDVKVPNFETSRFVEDVNQDKRLYFS